MTELTATEGAADVHFGESVAISGALLIVGAPNLDFATNSDAVYVYHRDEGGANNWGLVTKISAGDGTDVDWFGWSVAISGDTVIVGTLNDRDKGRTFSSVYVFRQDEGGSGNWGKVARITASDNETSRQFAESVAISGGTVIVGADRADHNGVRSGAACVYRSTVDCSFDGDGDGDIDLIDFGMFQAAFTGATK